MHGSSAAEGIVLAVDGGGTKTDLALIAADGTLLGHARGGHTQVHYLGVDRTVEVLQGLLEAAAAQAGLDTTAGPVASTAHLLLAGIDVPEEHAALLARLKGVGWSERLVLGNDTDALLRAGTDRGWGVAVVCGTGINCLGRAPDGREARFLSFGDISGDWGGGPDVGIAGLAAAVRAVDGRGPHTVLERVLPEHFGAPDPLALAQRFHLGELPQTRLGDICPLVLELHERDSVCAAIVGRLTDEIVSFARAALSRLDLLDSDAELVLGGGVSRNLPAAILDAIAAGVAAFGPNAQVIVSPSEPIVGAALCGLDALGAGDEARARARAALGEVHVRPGTATPEAKE